MIYNGVKVIKPDCISDEEVYEYLNHEYNSMVDEVGELVRIEVGLDGEDVVIKGVKKSDIQRLRRITGYLSSVDRFNDSKKAEMEDRVSHI